MRLGPVAIFLCLVIQEYSVCRVDLLVLPHVERMNDGGVTEQKGARTKNTLGRYAKTMLPDCVPKGPSYTTAVWISGFHQISRYKFGVKQGRLFQNHHFFYGYFERQLDSGHSIELPSEWAHLLLLLSSLRHPSS